MLNNIRKFSKTILAKILLVIIIIPFIFWGMGGVFNSGNSNNIVKINNHNITTQDFMDYLNSTKLTSEMIKENIDDNILEKVLSELISKIMLEMEIRYLDLSISDNHLIKKIKTNKSFLDEKNIFSRTKYEKFLLSSNITAMDFEKKLKENELKKKLFKYVSGGIKSPYFFVNKIYNKNTAKLEVTYIDLNKMYKKENEFSDIEIQEFLKKNKERFQVDIINFSYTKITPQNLIGSTEFNELYFEKIDELENSISNGKDFNEIIERLKIVSTKKINYSNSKDKNDLEKLIYQKRNEEGVQLIDKDEFYLLFNIDNIKKNTPKLTDKIFKKKVLKSIYQENIYNYNQELFKKIIRKDFLKSDFDIIAKNNEEKTLIKSNKDFSKFNADSIKNLYTLSEKSFSLVSDNENNIYLANLVKIKKDAIKKNTKEFMNYVNMSNIDQRNNLYSSFDFYLSGRYEVKVNEQTLLRVKNYFK